MSARHAALLSAALLGACLATAAFARSHAHAAHGASLIWRGDDVTAHSVVNEVAPVWERAGHGHVQLQPFNTASGIDAVTSGQADVAGSARASDGSAEDANLVFTPVAWDALVMITNASNPVRSLTLKQVHDIYYGKIHNWSEVGGRDAPIDVYAVASPGDGVEFSLRQLLFGRGNQPVAAPRLYVNTRKLEDGVALNPDGLGASTLSDIRGNPKLKALAINGVAPSVANLADGSYVLFSPLYLVTNPRGPKAAEAQAFVDFAQTAPAQAALRRHAVLPFRDGSALASMDRSRRRRILAEVGARASHIAPAATPVSAPGATYADRVAVAPTSPRTLAARQALEQRAAKDRAAAMPANEKTRLSGVSGSVAGTSVSSLAHASGAATTVNDPKTSGTDFSRVTAGANSAARSADRSADRGGKTYRVAKGDTLASIARAHDLDVARLRDWNHLTGNRLRPGQRLRLSRD
ncbi:MAG: substrate-binding domain-containing protein [Xanthomonadaceae bacterium]|nr:substrate-binding domain-containing protein [Xanthomonadaceae bacterium]MDE3073396.1 substrate-binding domain-containing protein [Pseudomonadota bacterium]